METIRISAVSYFNTIPFVYGIKNSRLLKNYELSIDVPSKCALKLIEGKADIGLVPVAALPKINNYQIVGNYCIGAISKVRTVCLYSQVPINEISKIYLDSHSMTSVNLVKVLARDYWKISPVWINTNEESILGLSKLESVVAIGDKTFELENYFKFCFDLAEHWIEFTKLPFVFACWVANKQLDSDFIANFDKSLEFGILNIEDALKDYYLNHPLNVDLDYYLKNNINYIFDEKKKNGMKLFLQNILP
ncbi:MAG: menaquinone biosynthesis protein [Bacteroidetes bacterium]|nr:menaquinone biosynthesis protein [Bacteroidota bacterium]